MTRIGIDPDAALLAVEQLAVVERGLDDQKHVPGPPLFALPPHVVATLEFDVLRLRADIASDAHETHRIRATLARTELQMLLAGGGGDAKTILALLRAVGFDGWGSRFGEGFDDVVGSDVGRSITDFFASIHDPISDGETWTVLPGYLALMGWAQLRHADALTPKQFMQAWNKQLGVFGDKGTIGKAFGRFGDALTLLQGYQDSSAVTPVGKAISSAAQFADLKAWDKVFGGLPVGSALDTVSGGVLTGGIDAIVVLGEGILTLDDTGFENFTADAVSGKKGFGIQAIAGLGEGISYIATGDVDDWRQIVQNGGYGPVLKGAQQVQDAAISAVWDGTAAAARATSSWSPFW